MWHFPRRMSTWLLIGWWVGVGACHPTGCDARPRGAADGSISTPSDGASPPERGGCECSHPGSFAPAVERIRPAVVNLYSTERDPGSESSAPSTLDRVVPGKRLVESLGSGLIIDEGGHLLTNHHLLEDADAIRARLLDDRWFETELVGTDPNTDLALLKLREAQDLPVAPLGEASDLHVGDWVVAIGNPLGLTSTVTAGIASGIGRSDLSLGEELTYQDFIQTDASINPGNSGGPLVDAEGNVVGLNTAISSEARGIGFAIPVSMIREILPKLRESGRVRRSRIGVYVEEVPEALRSELDVGSGGVLVTGVVEDGPAAEAGLRQGDVLLELDGRPVDDVDQVTWLAGHLEIDEPVECVVQRGRERLELQLTPDRKTED